MISTDVVNYCTAEILKAGRVADEAEGCHLAGDLQRQHSKQHGKDGRILGTKAWIEDEEENLT